jgi:hypothetical protein
LQQSGVEKPALKNYTHITSTVLMNKTTDPNSDQLPQVESEISSSISTICDAIITSSPGGRYPFSQGIGFACNERTIRWHNSCDNPVKEQQRIEKYKADRRQRYYDEARKKATTSRYYAEI